MIPRAIERLLGGRKVQPEGASALLSKLLESKSQGETGAAAKRSLEVIAERLRGGSMGKADRRFARLGLALEKPRFDAQRRPDNPALPRRRAGGDLLERPCRAPGGVAGSDLEGTGPDAPRLRALGALDRGEATRRSSMLSASILADRVAELGRVAVGAQVAREPGRIDDPRRSPSCGFESRIPASNPS